MKFNELLGKATNEIPFYRQPIFQIIIIGLVAGVQPGRISSIFRCFSNFIPSHFTLKRFYNFINSGKIPWRKLWDALLLELGDPSVDGRILLALDDELSPKTGTKIQDCATHFDHAAKMNSAKYIWGNCRVVVGLLRFIHHRWAFLPLAQGLYKPLAKKVKSSAKLPYAEWLKTKSGIAAQRIIGIAGKFTQNSILIVSDSWFCSAPLIKEVRAHISGSVHILSRLRVSAAIFDLPGPRVKKRGRAPRYGKRLPNVREFSTQLRNQARTAEIHVYGKEREISFSEIICMSKALKCRVKVIFVYYRNFAFPLVTTDLSLPAERMIEYYSARWKIESGFKEIKHEIGSLDSQCRNLSAVDNHFQLCLFATSIAWVYASKLPLAPPRRHPTRRSNAFAFADIRRKIASEISSSDIFAGCCRKSFSSHGFSACFSIFSVV